MVVNVRGRGHGLPYVRTERGIASGCFHLLVWLLQNSPDLMLRGVQWSSKHISGVVCQACNTIQLTRSTKAVNSKSIQGSFGDNVTSLGANKV